VQAARVSLQPFPLTRDVPLIAFAIRAVSGQAEAVAVTQNRDPMTVAGQIKKGTCFDAVTLRRVGQEVISTPHYA
jgi:hypothetical protein